MITYYSTSDFDKSLHCLIKKPKDGFTGVTYEICNDFISKSIDDIRENEDMILSEDTFNIIKLRLPDRNRNLGKSNGYRLFYHVHKEDEEVTFLYVYPKKGAKGLVTIKKGEVINLLSNYLKEKNTLTRRDINNELNIICEAETINESITE